MFLFCNFLGDTPKCTPKKWVLKDQLNRRSICQRSLFQNRETGPHFHSSKTYPFRLLFAIRDSRIDVLCYFTWSRGGQFMLKPQDIVILLKVLSMMALSKDHPDELLSQNKLATFVCMSASEVNAGMKRLVLSV